MTITEFTAYDIYKCYPDIDNDRYYNYKVKKKNKLIKGAKYMLKGLECDGFQMPTRVYQVVSLVNSVNEVVLDSVVMRQLKGFEDDTKFALSRQECQVLHIKYEPGLQLFPAGMLWKKYSERLETGKTVFVENDMSTYPVSRIDGCIRHIIVKIDRFYVDGNYVVDSEKDTKYFIDTFLSAMRITSKNLLVSHRNAQEIGLPLFKKEESFPFRIMVGESTDSLYVEIFLKKPAKSVTTEDGIMGIPPKIFKDKVVTDLFNIYIDEFKLNKSKKTKNVSSAIDHYQKKTGSAFSVKSTSFVGNNSGSYDINNKTDAKHRSHVGDIVFNPKKDTISIMTTDGKWEAVGLRVVYE